MDLSNPKLWTLGEAIKDILEQIPAIEGHAEKMFTTVSHGFLTPDKRAADRLPSACIVAPLNGSFKSENGLSVDHIRMKIPVYAYFHIPNSEQAIKTLYRFVQIFAHRIEDMNFNWFDHTVTAIPADFAIGDIFANNDDPKMELKPPFYGVFILLDVRINSGSL